MVLDDLDGWADPSDRDASLLHALSALGLNPEPDQVAQHRTQRCTCPRRRRARL